METVIVSQELQVERKKICVDFRENPRGRFLRITEEVADRRDTVIVPSTGLEDFIQAVSDVLAAAKVSA